MFDEVCNDVTISYFDFMRISMRGKNLDTLAKSEFEEDIIRQIRHEAIQLFNQNSFEK